MTEDQVTVCEWAKETFGPVKAPRAATRVLQELTELLVLMSQEVPSSAIRTVLKSECADIQITLYRLADEIGCDLVDEVDRKMAINRSRKWKLDGSGCGQHIKEQS